MKPSLHQLGLATLLLGAAAQLHAQPQAAPPELLTSAPPWAGSSPFCWGTVPVPRPLPYGYVWNDYRGADIEHPLYAPKHHGHVARSSCGCSPFSCWFDKLFTRQCSGCAESCEGHVATELPPLPTLAPFPPPVPSIDSSPIQLTPLPLPAPPVVAVPVPQPEPDNRLRPAPIDPAPVMPPVDLIPTRPLVTADPPATEPKPLAAVPLETTPVEPAPSEPRTIETTPRTTIEPGLTAIDDPKPIANERAPIVELAPDFLLDGEPTTVPPSPSVAPPPAAAPRNVIPPRSAPRNTIPGSR